MYPMSSIHRRILLLSVTGILNEKPIGEKSDILHPFGWAPGVVMFRANAELILAELNIGLLIFLTWVLNGLQFHAMHRNIYCLGNPIHSRSWVCGLAILFGILQATNGQNSASASCGDWLAHPDAGVAVTDLSGRSMVTDGLLSELLQQVPEKLARQKTPSPCNGTNCRSGRQFPEHPIPARPISSTKDLGCPPRLIKFETGHLFGRQWTELSIGTPSRHSSRIDRPPII